MFEKDAIHSRGKALEDEFFYRIDMELRAKRQAQLDREQSREKLATATGFQDEELLDHLLDAGFAPSTLTALALVPTVFVAWADGNVTVAERQAILSAALHRGVHDEPTAFAMIESWLHKRPPQSLWDLWQEYAHALSRSLAPALASILHREILRLATTVAEASGGYFGRGEISKAEQAILDQIADLETTP
ncbi:MAG: hypothetical protein WBD20_23650 [Pirellulaceae bacterium]